MGFTSIVLAYIGIDVVAGILSHIPALLTLEHTVPFLGTCLNHAGLLGLHLSRTGMPRLWDMLCLVPTREGWETTIKKDPGQTTPPMLYSLPPGEGSAQLGEPA